jgi:glycerophosphoryl diester phosphodiesterase
VQLGPRPFYLVDQMDESALKTKLQQCATRQFKKTDFSIGHRGAAMQFPEHTKESYEAAARMGAGILECDVTFTSDGELVCRHAQCDLHTTTDILARPELAAKCSQPFVPADPIAGTPASARCCASDITLAEFKTLCGKMDARDSSATTVEEYLGGTANWRTDLYATCATVLSHAESIELFDSLDRKYTPELKSGNAADIAALFGSQEGYAQAMIDEYKVAGINPKNVWAQSFNLDDVLYWIANEPDFGRQAVYLDSSPIPHPDPGPFLQGLADQGVNIVAPPMPMLLTLDGDDKIVPSAYAHAAKQAGVDIITWTLERSGRIVEEVLEGRGSAFYYQTTLGGLSNDGDIMVTLDVLAQEVGILGIFSDWPATVTYYSNCTNP